MRTPYLSERRRIADRIYHVFVRAFGTHDFTEWKSYPVEEAPNSLYNALREYTTIIEVRNSLDSRTYRELDTSYLDIMPPYCSRFTPYFGYKLCTYKPVDIGMLLDAKFETPDATDCDYLEDVVAEIQDYVARGIGFDPGHDDGLDYLLPAESIVTANIDSSLRWIVRTRTRLVNTPAFTPPTQTVSTKPQKAPRIEWYGEVTDLAEILHRLERGGKISLKKYFENGGKGVDLCRRLIDIFYFGDSKAVDNLNGYLSHLKKAFGPGEIDEGVMQKIGRKKGGKMGDSMPT